MAAPQGPMPKPLPSIRLVLALAAAAVTALVGAGCGTDDADIARGRVLFVQKCGTCHVLAQAGSSAQIGPNLDAAFAAARAAGMDSDTIEGIVAQQIQNPRQTDPDETAVYMPPDLVTGQSLVDVAAYVAEYAGVPGAAPPKVPGGPGAQVFANFGCGGCHTLAAANAGGTVGPNLDETLAGQPASYVEKGIVDPNAQQTPGFPLNVMPQDYEAQMSPQELSDLVQYLVSETSGTARGTTGAGRDVPAAAKPSVNEKSGAQRPRPAKQG
jgi:mono/diheme cytochrome c family protein